MEFVIDKDKNVRAIGDVHGGFDEFEAMVTEAVEQDRYVLQLGDLEDRGPDPAKCIELMMDLNDQGKGHVVMSNHGWKHYRFYQGRPVSVSETHKLTRIDIDAKGEAFVERYKTFMGNIPWYVNYGKNFFAHASYHPIADETERSKKEEDILRSRLVYGMTNGVIGENGLPMRLLDWFDYIPEGRNVFIGHHILSMNDILSFTTDGGTAHFVDLGHQTYEGGKLAYVDFDAGEIVGTSHAIKIVDDPREYGAYRIEE